jgi:hypothetical protein
METARFSEQISRYLESFGTEQVFVIVYDDFAANTQKVYQEVLRFLDVRNQFMPDFKVVNANRVVRSHVWHRFIKQGSPAMRQVWRRALPTSVRGRLLRIANRINTVESARPEMRAETRVKLQDTFKPEVRKLSAILERDLTPWVEHPTGNLLSKSEIFP